MVVLDPNYLSDHCQVTAWFDLYKPNLTSNTQPELKLEKLPFQYIWSDTSKENFIHQLKTKETQNKLKTFLENNYERTKESINQCASDFQDIISQACKKSLKLKKKKHSRSSNIANKKWFDKECRIKRHELRKLANQKHNNPNNIEMRHAYHTTLKNYKITIERKKNQFHETQIQKLETATTDPKEFWKVLKNSSDEININDTRTPKPSEWLAHF